MAGPALEDYKAKRQFSATPEPPGEVGRPEGAGNRWVVQQHAARRMHYDFRLEAGGVLISWAVPKGPSYNPAEKRLAVKVEDHPLDYREFEGIIPKGNYGAGSVIVWDEGTYRNMTERRGKPVSLEEGVAAGHISFWLDGHKLVGGWSLTRFGSESTSWALVKRNDDKADPGKDITKEAPRSVKSGLTVQEVGASPDVKEWKSNRPEPGGHPAVTERPESTASLAPAKFQEPMLAEAASSGEPTIKGPLARPDGQWLFEPKLDGLRCIAVRNGGDIALFSRNRLPFTARFPSIVQAVSALPAGNFVLDGEVVGMVERRPDFGALQGGQAPSIEYWVFDLPWLLGHDLRHLPIESRKSLLVQTVQESGPIKVVPSLEGDANQLLEQACQQGWEGLVAKRAGSVYREGRSADWRKLKCGRRQEMVIGGFTEPHGARGGFGALLLGYWQQDELVYAGKVGTGFTEATIKKLLEALLAIERPSSPFAGRVTEKGAHWVEPDLVAEVAFSNWTPDGRLRHPSFLGLRTDKVSHEVVREETVPRPTGR